MGLLRYKKLFNVLLQHNFYVNGITRDFDIVPTPETSRILRNNKLAFKLDQTGFRVFYRTEENTELPFVAFADLELRFTLQLKNSNEFLNFTNLDILPQVFGGGNLIWFTNDANVTNNVLEYGIIDQLKSKVFTYEFPKHNDPALIGSIQIKNEQDIDVTPASPDPNNVPITSNGNFLYPIDFSNMPSGRYEFITTVGASVKTRFLYLDDTLTLSGTFGVIKILVEDYEAFPVADPPLYSSREYGAIFTRRETIWKYVFVLKSEKIDPTDTIDFVDLETTPPAPYDQYEFERILPNIKVNNIDAIIFQSKSGGSFPKIPFYEIQKKGLQLSKTDPTPIIEINDVSNPQRNIVSFETDSGGAIEKSIVYIYV